MDKKIPEPIRQAITEVAKRYSDSPATTNAGRILRIFSKLVTIDMVVKLFAHKLK
jgi:hypothetical protein